MLNNADEMCSLENAEGEILSSLIVRPDFLQRLEIVDAEWFSRGEDRLLWKAFTHAAQQNDGVPEPATARNFIEQRQAGLGMQLLDRMAGHVNRNYGAGPLADSLFDYHLGVLRNNGVRRTHWKWAKAIALCCEQRGSLQELRAIVDDKPGFGKAVAQ
jgi:hypothetical protein